MHGQAVLERKCADEQAAVRVRTSPSAATAVRIPPSHAPMTVASVQRLQALAGNRAVSAFLAPAAQRPRPTPASGARPRHEGRSHVHAAVQREDMGLPTEQPAGLSPRFADDDNLQDVFKGRKFMAFGWYGCSVKKVQQALIEAGHELPGHDVDGDFRTETRAAVVAFQRSQDGLAADGIVGRLTLDRLQKSVAPTPVRAVDCYIPPKPEEKKGPIEFPDDEIESGPCAKKGKCDPGLDVEGIWPACGVGPTGEAIKCIPIAGEPCGVCQTLDCGKKIKERYEAIVKECKAQEVDAIEEMFEDCLAEARSVKEALQCMPIGMKAKLKAEACKKKAWDELEQARKECEAAP